MGTILLVGFRWETDIKNPVADGSRGFLIDFCVFSQNRTISKNLNH